LSVSAVVIARDEYQAWLPRVVRGSACQAAIAASVNQCQAPTLAQGRIVFGPVRHPAPLLWDAMTASGMGLERHGA
jgi:hypothetical protein